jgi:hypothetical protein
LASFTLPGLRTVRGAASPGARCDGRGPLFGPAAACERFFPVLFAAVFFAAGAFRLEGAGAPFDEVCIALFGAARFEDAGAALEVGFALGGAAFLEDAGFFELFGFADGGAVLLEDFGALFGPVRLEDVGIELFGVVFAAVFFAAVFFFAAFGFLDDAGLLLGLVDRGAAVFFAARLGVFFAARLGVFFAARLAVFFAVLGFGLLGVAASPVPSAGAFFALGFFGLGVFGWPLFGLLAFGFFAAPVAPPPTCTCFVWRSWPLTRSTTSSAFSPGSVVLVVR